MAIAIREFCGDNNISSDTSKIFGAPVALQEAEASSNLAVAPGTLIAEIEGIHAFPYRTKNYTRYMPDALRRSQHEWCRPYCKPVIRNHEDTHGEIIGRILDASYTEQTAVKNSGGLLFTASIPDEKVAKEVENNILQTVSIGVSASDVRCSICGTQITDASEGCPNGHERGGFYEGHDDPCCWDIYDFSPKELSFVIVPSDSYGMTKRVYRMRDQSIESNITETLDESVKKSAMKSKYGDKQNHMELEKQLAEAQKKVEELQAQLDKANEALKELESLKAMKAEKLEQDKKLAEIQALLDNQKKELDETKQKLVVSEEHLATVSEEKEAAIETGLMVKEQLRQFACSTLNQYRKISGRSELAEEELKKRSIDSILDSVMDFREDLNDINKKDIEEKPEKEDFKLKEFTVPNPAAPQNETPVKTEHNKDYQIVDLAEGLSKMFAEAAKLN